MLARSGGKLADFGIARIPDSTLTHQGGLMGTPAYSAPETFRAGKFSAASDQFSLAASLYEAISGRRAFPGDDAVAVATRIANEPPERFAASIGLLPAVDEVLARALDRHPELRFPTCEAFGAALAQALCMPLPAAVALGGGTSPSLGSSPALAAAAPVAPPSPRRLGQVVLGGIMVVATGALIVHAEILSSERGADFSPVLPGVSSAQAVGTAAGGAHAPRATAPSPGAVRPPAYFPLVPTAHPARRQGSADVRHPGPSLASEIAPPGNAVAGEHARPAVGWPTGARRALRPWPGPDPAIVFIQRAPCSRVIAMHPSFRRPRRLCLVPGLSTVAGLLAQTLLPAAALAGPKPALVITQDQSLDGDVGFYESVTVKAGATVTVTPYVSTNPAFPGYVQIQANTITIEQGAAIRADGAGFPGVPGMNGLCFPMMSCAGAGTVTGYPGGGGGYFGQGADGMTEMDAGACVDLMGGAIGGAAFSPVVPLTGVPLGSAGGASNLGAGMTTATAGAPGGGGIRLSGGHDRARRHAQRERGRVVRVQRRGPGRRVRRDDRDPRGQAHGVGHVLGGRRGRRGRAGREPVVPAQQRRRGQRRRRAAQPAAGRHDQLVHVRARRGKDGRLPPGAERDGGEQVRQRPAEGRDLRRHRQRRVHVRRLRRAGLRRRRPDRPPGRDGDLQRQGRQLQRQGRRGPERLHQDAAQSA